MIDRLLGALRHSVLRRSFVALDITTAIVALAVLLPAVAQARFAEGMQDSRLGTAVDPAQTPFAFGAMRTAHAGFERVSVPWSGIAPRALPAGFDPSNPASIGYHWATIDSADRLAAQHHVNLILDQYYSPAWALGPNRPTGPNSGYITPGAWNPDPGQFTKFIRAMATRYSGTYPDPENPGHTLPRVRYWEVWNEPNIPGYYAAPNSVEAYRTLLNDSYRVLKGIHADNTVLLGGTAPVGGIPYSTSPLAFNAALLCLRRVHTHFVRAGKCPHKAHFDVLNHHPYAFASSPTKHAYHYDDLLVSDMGKLRSLLDTAERLHTIDGGHHELWATEFAWPTNPPNTTLGDSPTAAARYVAYSLYEMWQAGVSLVVWSPVIDRPTNAVPTNVGTGLVLPDGTPKLTLSAFAFPFVAAVHGRRGSAWGRVPTSHAVKVFVQREAGKRWRTVSTVHSSRDGVFTARFHAHGNATYRAVVAHGQTSLTYFSARIPPRRLHLASSSFG